jgi:hypothetical protein
MEPFNYDFIMNFKAVGKIREDKNNIVWAQHDSIQKVPFVNIIFIECYQNFKLLNKLNH